MKYQHTDVKIKISELINLTPELAAMEFKKYIKLLTKNHKTFFFEYYDTEIEEVLFKRNEKIINLALAQFGSNINVVSKLYTISFLEPENEFDIIYLKGLKLACLSNQIICCCINDLKHAPEIYRFPVNIIGDDELQRIVILGDIDEQTALFTNPAIHPSILVNLYNKKSFFSEIDDERRRGLVFTSINNPKLFNYHKNNFDFDYISIHDGIFNLFENVPVTLGWLSTLTWMMYQFNVLNFPTPESSPVHILKKWKNLEESDGKYGLCTNELTELNEFCCFIAAFYGNYFSNEDELLHLIGDANSDDLFLRCAFYGNANLTLDEMKAGYRRDSEAYLLSVICNANVYKENKLRKMLDLEQLTGHEKLRKLYLEKCTMIGQYDPNFNSRPMSEWWIEKIDYEKKLNEISESINKIEHGILLQKSYLGSIIKNQYKNLIIIILLGVLLYFII